MKYILVTGGVISGVGKGIIASSLGTILKSCGMRVTSIKIDPYLNIDAGTFSPYEHGEVFVLDDGGEVDLDLGNYERFLDVTLHRDNNITTGKIYRDVIEKERKGDYLGKTVQVVPHITDAIQEWIIRVAKVPVDGNEDEPEVCIIELGGTIGDIEGMPFVEAFRQFQFRVGPENFLVCHVSLVPQPGTTGEQKSKPTQNSVRSLRGLGLSPDLIMCRSQNPLQPGLREKIAMFCHVPPNQVISVYDCTSIYRVPILLESQQIIPYFSKRLDLEMKSPTSRRLLSKWEQLAERHENVKDVVAIALVGKYTKFEDSYMSVIKALKHAALSESKLLKIVWIEAANLEEETLESDAPAYYEAWKKLSSCNGVLVPGGFGLRGVEGKVSAVKWARERKVPFLGVCLGLQAGVIEFSRNVLGWTDAHSKEFAPDTEHPVIIEMPEHNNGDLGGTMRLGKRRTIFVQKESSIMYKLYGRCEFVEERHRHRYEVNPDIVSQLEEHGLKFVGRDEEGKRMEIMELEGHPYFVAVQYHPEYLTRPVKPSPPYLGLILAASGQLQST
ncbi:CTP synthase 1-A-like [Sycon ciliatum]|uniref:CTP synthase 1-A-like n=1 Tax=Sycon ciliatum TaxID=27933 RepID=UPI0020AB74E2|eukprot:scpid65186/ scgid34843/ CTP synthase 1-A; CTP synthetase 1-A; UTP--ammonia ligase 1-A